MPESAPDHDVVVAGVLSPFQVRACVEYEPGTFVARIQDSLVRQRLAIHISTNGIYGELDRGAGFDNALATSMHLAIENSRFLDSFVDGDAIPHDSGWTESEWHTALDAMEADERPDYEPGKVRKALAASVLRQEIVVGNYMLNLTPWRDRSPTSAEGIM